MMSFNLPHRWGRAAQVLRNLSVNAWIASSLVLGGLVWAAPQAKLPDPLSQAVKPVAGKPKTGQALGVASGVAVSGHSVVAVGPRGLIALSTDDGQTWAQVASPVSTDLSSVRFTSATTAWALGHDAVMLRSDDTGKTWRKVLDGRDVASLLSKTYEAGPAWLTEDVQRTAAQSATPGVWTAPFLDIGFVNDQQGYAVGGFGLLLKTEDGGKTWKPWLEHSDNSRLFHLYSVAVRGSDVWIAGEMGLLMRLQGERFTAVKTPYHGTYFGIDVRGPNVLAYGLRGNVYFSPNEGKDWQQIPTGTEASVVSAWMDDASATLFSQDGEVFHADLKAHTAQVRPLKTGPETYGAARVSGGAGWVVVGITGVKSFSAAADQAVTTTNK